MSRHIKRIMLGAESGTTYRRLGDVTALVRREVEVDPDADYIEIGVRSFHKGTFHRRTLKGAEFTWQGLYQVKKDDLIFSNIMAWEGAVAQAKPEDDGCIGNHRMLTCECDRSIVEPAFLAHYFKTPEGMSKLTGASAGTVARNRTLTATALANMEVPVPPIEQQRGLVAHLEALAEKARQVEEHLNAIDNASSALLLSLHHKLANGRMIRLGDVIELFEQTEPIIAAGVYPQVGVRGFGGGLFAKSSINGTETAYRTFNRLYTGAIVLSQVKGWEGAIAPCPVDLDGWFVSPEYRTFQCLEGQACPEYLGELVRTEWFWSHLQAATRGVGARRERTRPEQFLNIELPLPRLADQIKIVEILRRQSLLKAKHVAIREANAALLPATLERIFTTSDDMGGA